MEAGERVFDAIPIIGVTGLFQLISPISHFRRADECIGRINALLAISKQTLILAFCLFLDLLVVTLGEIQADFRRFWLAQQSMTV